MRLRGNLIVLMVACWKINVRETAEVGLQHICSRSLIAISNPNIGSAVMPLEKFQSSSSKGQNPIPINLRGIPVADYLKINEFLRGKTS